MPSGGSRQTPWAAGNADAGARRLPGSEIAPDLPRSREAGAEPTQRENGSAMRKMMSRANRTAVAVVATAFMASAAVVTGA
ncbi:hypothetical protein, partial [Streptomyces hayashii]|uniref:hypothetical protein n=1 Tax=Streptomyces hayashii TaxID=2839966 RepID=UPI00403D1D57